MTDLKVMTIVGTRPEIIRLSTLIPKLDLETNHLLVHTGQNYDYNLNDVFFRDLELRAPDYFLGVDASTLGTVMGETISKSEKILAKERPDAVIILGDTNSALAAIVAERMHIPVYHLEAGNRSFDRNVPEELNRKLVDHIASFNLPYNDYSMRNLLGEGIHPRTIQKTGSPIAEIYEKYKASIFDSQVLRRLDLTPSAYFLVSIHRQENVDTDSRLTQVLDGLRALRDTFELPVLVSTHPRTRAKLQERSALNFEGIIFHEPFGYFDYNNLQRNAFCVVSDSGTISEESSIIGFPAVTMRDSMERPEAMTTGAILMSGLEADNLIRCVQYATKRGQTSEVPEGYDVKDFSERVFTFLLSTYKQHRRWANLIR